MPMYIVTGSVSRGAGKLAKGTVVDLTPAQAASILWSNRVRLADSSVPLEVATPEKKVEESTKETPVPAASTAAPWAASTKTKK